MNVIEKYITKLGLDKYYPTGWDTATSLYMDLGDIVRVLNTGYSILVNIDKTVRCATQLACYPSAYIIHTGNDTTILTLVGAPVYSTTTVDTGAVVRRGGGELAKLSSKVSFSLE